jgi:hypothetical protein
VPYSLRTAAALAFVGIGLVDEVKICPQANLACAHLRDCRADSLLSQAPNIHQFAIRGHPDLLPALKRPLFSGDLPLQRLRAFQCVNCGPEIWEIIPHFPRLSWLSLRNHSCGLSTLQLQASSLPIKHILLEECNLGS